MPSIAELPPPPPTLQLPPPPKVHNKRSDESKATTIRHRGLRPKDSKNRRSTQPGYELSLKPQKFPEDPIFAQFYDKAEKEDTASCVFLLWGSRKSEKFTSWAVDVPTTKLESEDLIFAAMARRYAEELGFWRRWLCFRKFSKLHPVIFRFICHSSKKFLASVEPMDLTEKHKICSERREEAIKHTKAMLHYHESDPWFSRICRRDNNGEWEHRAVDCPTREDIIRECPFEEREECEDQMRWIQTALFLSYYFRSPAGARSQNILEGSSELRFVYQYRNVRPSVQKRESQTRYLQLNGLYIETTWEPMKCLLIFLGLLVCVLAIGRICWGSWEITFGAGSFLVALPMLVLAVFSYFEY